SKRASSDILFACHVQSEPVHQLRVKFQTLLPRSHVRSLILVCAASLLAACAAPPQPTTAPPTTAPLLTPRAAATSAASNSTPGVPPVASPSPAASSPSSGQFVYATGEGNIILMDAATLKPKAIQQGSATEIDDSPAFSPDGKQIVYITHVLDPKAPTNEIRAMNLDGSNARPLFKPAAAQATRLFPTFPR